MAEVTGRNKVQLNCLDKSKQVEFPDKRPDMRTNVRYYVLTALVSRAVCILIERFVLCLSKSHKSPLGHAMTR